MAEIFLYAPPRSAGSGFGIEFGIGRFTGDFSSEDGSRESAKEPTRLEHGRMVPIDVPIRELAVTGILQSQPAEPAADAVRHSSDSSPYGAFFA
jgi:hypothetical protein